MRRVVLVAYYYPPMGGAAANRLLGFARHLPAHGWAPTVVAPVDGTFASDPSLPLDLPPPGRVIRCLSPEPATLLKRAFGRRGRRGPGGAMVEEVALGIGGSWLRRVAREWLYVPDAQAPWIPFAALAAIRACRGADAILSSGPPVSAHVAAWLASRATGVPWTADVRDLWTPRTLRPETARARLDEWVLRGVLHRADRITTVVEAWVDMLARRLDRPRADIAVVPNGFDPADHGGERVPPERFTLTFTGLTHGEMQDLTVFLGTLARLLDGEEIARDRFRVRIVGRLDAYSCGLVARFGLEDVVVDEGFSTHRHATAAQRDATALLLLLWSADDAVQPGVRPAKLPEYLGAGRPVLTLGDPECEAARILDECGAGSTRRFDDAAGIAGILVSLYRRWERDGDLPRATDPARATPHSRFRLAGRLAAALGATSAHRPPGRPHPRGCATSPVPRVR